MLGHAAKLKYITTTNYKLHIKLIN